MALAVTTHRKPPPSDVGLPATPNDRHVRLARSRVPQSSVKNLGRRSNTAYFAKDSVMFQACAVRAHEDECWKLQLGGWVDETIQIMTISRHLLGTIAIYVSLQAKHVLRRSLFSTSFLAPPHPDRWSRISQLGG